MIEVFGSGQKQFYDEENNFNPINDENLNNDSLTKS